jgi:hypothetical protein
MKITKQQLRRVIQEELTQVLREVGEWDQEAWDATGPATDKLGSSWVPQEPAFQPTLGARTTPTPGGETFRGERGDPYEYKAVGDGSYMFRDTGTPGSEFQMAKGAAAGAIDKLRKTGQSGYQAPAAAATPDMSDYGQTVTSTIGTAKGPTGAQSGMGTTTYAGPGRRRQAVKDLGGSSKAGRQTVRQAIRGPDGAAQTARQQRQDRKGGLRRSDPLSKLGRRTLTLPSAE